MISVISTQQELEMRKRTLVEYLKMKTHEEDWHGVADAAMDLREIEVYKSLVEKAVRIAEEKVAKMEEGRKANLAFQQQIAQQPSSAQNPCQQYQQPIYPQYKPGE